MTNCYEENPSINVFLMTVIKMAGSMNLEMNSVLRK